MVMRESFLEKAKRSVADRLVEIYVYLADELDPKEYPYHFNQLGEKLGSLKVIDSISVLATALENGDFSPAVEEDEESVDDLFLRVRSDYKV